MPEIAASSGLTQDQVISLIADKSPIKFIANGDPMTLDQLHSAYAPSVTYDRQFANVSDLYGSVSDTMRCRFDGTAYRWVPQREAFNGTSGATSGSVTILPLATPPTLRFTQALTGNITTTMSTDRAYIGQRKRIVVSGLLGIYGFSVGGLIGSNVSLLTGGVKDFEYASNGWFAA